ncbi:MAG: hypothetical protein H7A45_12690 [Verrucomicrobiales bacterium]|nr:hypothetical protein [Verrucomicrobiales bacterium]
MLPESWRDASLVLLGHGTELNSGSAVPVRHQASALRARGLFATVAGVFWKQEPKIQRVLPRLPGSRVFIVPWFATAGYFAEEVIPARLGFPVEGVLPERRLRREPGRTWHYTEPVGTHPRLTDLLLEQAAAVVERHPFPVRPDPASTALILIGHGTPRSPRARREVEARAAALRERGGYAEVHTVYLEEDPRVGDCHRLAAARQLVIVSLFLSPGLHAAQDVPVLLGEGEANVQRRLREGRFSWRNPTERHGKLIWYAPSIGLAPALGDIVLERVREAARWAGP